MAFSFGVFDGQFFIFPEDFEVAVFYDKNVIKEKGGKEIDGGGKKSGLSRGCKAGMFYYVEVEGFQQQQPSSGAEGEQVQGLYAGVETLAVLAYSIEIAIDIKIEVIYVFHRVVFEFRVWQAPGLRVAGAGL